MQDILEILDSSQMTRISQHELLPSDEGSNPIKMRLNDLCNKPVKASRRV
jgi:hypothetical protein